VNQKRLLIILAAAAVAVVGWALFRPELLFVNKGVNETLTTPATAASGGAEAMALASGAFHAVSHETAGTATIYTLPDGSRVLRLTGFHTSNGPDVHVYLVNAADATDNDTVTRAGFVDLGSLKGNVGDQNYDLPADVTVPTPGAVTIWCKRFGVNFATAPLAPPS
jgi:hypothetical protein